MGIVSIVSFVIVLYFLYVARKHVRKVARGGDDEFTYMARWGQRLLTLALVVNVVWIVDSFFYKIPNPFSGPRAEDLRATPPTMKAPEPLKLKADPMEADVQKAKAEHKKQLKEFEGQ